MVNRSLSQSQDEPSLLSWLMILPPYSFRHSQTRSMNLSRPIWWRSVPSAANWRSTTFWVAIPAWSVPGCHRVLKPSIRL